MTRWPLWRLLVWSEVWLLAVAAVHRHHPIHQAFVVPLLIAVVPVVGLTALWATARAAVGATSAPASATWVELTIAALAVASAALWTGEWTLQARADLRRFDEMIGQATIIVDVSLTGLSVAACLAALALDFVLATAHESLRQAMAWVRRFHLLTTVASLVALFGAGWLLTRWPASQAATGLVRARAVIHVYQFAQATVFPLQALFAALSVAVVALDSRGDDELAR